MIGGIVSEWGQITYILNAYTNMNNGQPGAPFTNMV